MSTPIYVREDGADRLTQTLLRIMLARQNQEVQAEDLKIRQQEIKLRAQERQDKQQDEQAKLEAQQGAQLPAVMQLLAPMIQGAGVAGSFAGGGMPAPQMQQPTPQQAQFGQIANMPGMTQGVAYAAAQPLAKQMNEDAEIQRAIGLARPILDSKQIAGMEAAMRFARAGITKDVWQDLIPSGMVALAKAKVEADNAADARQANIIATEWLANNVPGMKGIGYIEDATKLLGEEWKNAQNDARKRSLELEKQRRELAVKAAEGDAIGVAFSLPVGSSLDAVASELLAYHPDLSPGAARKAASDGLAAANKLRLPQSDFEAKTRTHFEMMKVAVPNIDDLEEKGVRITGKSERATEDYSVGSFDVPLLSPLLRNRARAALSPDERRLLNQVQIFGTAVLRKDSGATLSAKEERAVMDEYFPLSTDDPAMIMQKRQNRMARYREMAIQSNQDPNQYAPGLRERLESETRVLRNQKR